MAFKLQTWGLNKWLAQVIHIGFWARLLAPTASSSAMFLESVVFLALRSTR